MDKERGKFSEYIRKEAMKYRRKKIKEIMEKEKPSENELSMIKFWIETYGNETY